MLFCLGFSWDLRDRVRKYFLERQRLVGQHFGIQLHGVGQRPACQHELARPIDRVNGQQATALEIEGTETARCRISAQHAMLVALRQSGRRVVLM